MTIHILYWIIFTIIFYLIYLIFPPTNKNKFARLLVMESLFTVIYIFYTGIIGLHWSDLHLQFPSIHFTL